jgi:hypothetical protein
MDLVQGLVMSLLIYWLIGCGSLTWTKVAEAFVPPLATTAVAAAAVSVCFHFAARWPVETLWPATVWGAAFFVLYLAGLRLCFRRQLAELVCYFPRRAFMEKLLRL